MSPAFPPYVNTGTNRDYDDEIMSRLYGDNDNSLPQQEQQKQGANRTKY